MVCDLNGTIKWNLMQPDEFRHATVRLYIWKRNKCGNFYVRFLSFILFILAFAVEQNGEKLKLRLFGWLFSDAKCEQKKKPLQRYIQMFQPWKEWILIACLLNGWIERFLSPFSGQSCRTDVNSIWWNVFSLRWNEFRL